MGGSHEVAANGRAAWVERLSTLRDGEVASFGEMRLHNPQYFREADVNAEFRTLLPEELLIPDPRLPITSARLVELAKGRLCRVGVLRALGFEK